ncbi:Hypothetical predicted protein [Octopus vulgaris]|uniref:Uncharacterized protein n=1 Tax=Octopus vulgaris TaxID=6645 RepID=A0AA36B6C2_OCTVU|nr:Hypothetical predicted protein [Octopus vulgaris]
MRGLGVEMNEKERLKSWTGRYEPVSRTTMRGVTDIVMNKNVPKKKETLRRNASYNILRHIFGTEKAYHFRAAHIGYIQLCDVRVEVGDVGGKSLEV